MTIARKDIVDNEVPVFYQCINRCAPKALCGAGSTQSVLWGALKRAFISGVAPFSGQFFTAAKNLNGSDCKTKITLVPSNGIIPQPCVLMKVVLNLSVIGKKWL